MSKFTILGVSQDSIAIIFDMIMEIKGKVSFNLFPNIELDIKPLLPNKGVNYEIKPLRSHISSSEDVFFGCATPKVKRTIFNYFNKNYQINESNYIKVIHPSAYIAKTSLISYGVMVQPNSIISSQSNIGFGVFIKRGSSIGHHNNIGDFTDINPGVVTSGKVTIGKGCIIGSGAVLKDNISIGENTIIGIGSVVTKNIPANCIAYGNPCRVMKTLD